MALARWKDLCVDAAAPRGPAVTCLTGQPARRTVWVNAVPEA